MRRDKAEIGDCPPANTIAKVAKVANHQKEG
jgi:hypothetical protein